MKRDRPALISAVVFVFVLRLITKWRVCLGIDGVLKSRKYGKLFLYKGKSIIKDSINVSQV
jgi:hypothetical protein